MSGRAGAAGLLVLLVSALIAGCSWMEVSPKVPVIGRPPDLQVDAVRSIKAVTVQRIAVMPLVEAPQAADRTVIEGSGETITAELVGQMSLAGGWEVVPEGDVADAMQKLPPLTLANQKTTAIALGKKLSAEVVLYGTVDRFKERVGIAYAAASPAAVEFTLHLVQVQSGQVIWSARFARSQKALFENMLNIVSFVQSTGRWVKAHEIAQEGVEEAVDNLHGQLNVARNELRFPGGSIEEQKRAILRSQQKEATQ